LCKRIITNIIALFSFFLQHNVNKQAEMLYKRGN
jgi:hypothetical protein